MRCANRGRPRCAPATLSVAPATWASARALDRLRRARQFLEEALDEGRGPLLRDGALRLAFYHLDQVRQEAGLPSLTER